MISLFVSNLWSNIKKSPIITIIVFLQLVLTAFFLFLSVYQQADIEFDNNYVQNAYSTNKLFYTGPNNLSITEMNKSHGVAYREDTDYSNYELFVEKISASETVRTAVQQIESTMFTIDYPVSKLGIRDKSTGDYSYIRENINDSVTRLNAMQIDKNYIEIFGLQIEDGRLFDDDDFTELDPDHVPVILGHDYSQFFSVGDTFKASYLEQMGTQPNGKTFDYMTFEIIGFVKEDAFFYKIASDKPVPFDTYIIIPYIYKSLDEWLAFRDEYNTYTTTYYCVNQYTIGTGIGVFTTKQYVTDELHEAAALAEMEEYLKEAGLNEEYKMAKVIGTSQLADQYEERTNLQGYLLAVMLVLSLMSIIFASVNKISGNIKTYAVHELLGATQRRIIIYSVSEVFVYCVLGFAAGYLWFRAMFSGVQAEMSPAFSTGITNSLVLSGIFTIAACMLSLLFVFIKIRGYSISLLIRGNEVKKNSRVSAYKLITFIMLAFVSVCVTFLTSYNWQVNHIDKYQRHFYGKDAYIFQIQPLAQENAPELKIQYDIEADNYVVDMIIRDVYDTIMGPAMRGTYFKGDVELPEMTWGRYFSEDEVKNLSKFVVVGKNVIEDFVTEKDGKLIYSYLDSEYEVIGIMGREGHDTTVDNWVVFTMPTVQSVYGARGSYIVDAPTAEEIDNVMSIFEEQLSPISMYMKRQYKPTIELGISEYVLNVFIVLIILTAIVFSVYYIDKIRHILNVKKFLGYSKGMIFADTAGQFILLSVIAYILGNGIMLALSKTALKDVTLFSVFSVNLPVLSFSLGALLLIAFLFSLLAIYRSFRGTARDLRRG